MRSLSDCVMQSRWHALLMAVLCTLVPLLDWLGLSIMALVILHKGEREGLYVLLAIIAAQTVLASNGQNWLSFFYGAGLGSLMVWVMAVLLYRYASWSLVLEVSALLAVIAVLIVHWTSPNLIAEWWQTQANAFVLQLNQLGNAPDLQTTLVKSRLSMLAHIAPGIIAASILINNFFCLFLARGWQGNIVGSGSLRNELHHLRLGYCSAIFLVLILLTAKWFNGVALELLPIAGLLFVLVGISLTHYFAKLTAKPWLWLTSFYGLLITFLPYMMVILAGIVLTDVWVDLRVRFATVIKK